MRPLRILTLAFLLFTLTAAAQTDRRTLTFLMVWCIRVSIWGR